MIKKICWIEDYRKKALGKKIQPKNNNNLDSEKFGAFCSFF